MHRKFKYWLELNLEIIGLQIYKKIYILDVDDRIVFKSFWSVVNFICVVFYDACCNYYDLKAWLDLDGMLFFLSEKCASYFYFIISSCCFFSSFQCFVTVGWATGRASGL